MMRRSSKKAGTASAPSSSSAKASSKEADKLEAFFAKYKDKSEENCIGPSGVENLCQDLGIDTSDVRILLLAWKLQASRQGYFTHEEWQKGMKAMRVDSVDKLKKALPGLQQEILNKDAFKDFYAFAFSYCLTEPRQKTLDIETASQMMEIVLENNQHLSSFIDFLKEQKEYKAINLDQWMAFLRFRDEVQLDLVNYDENMAWPLLMDNYVEWARQRQKA
eukprot:TRINITY_DN5826_c0_g1_i1.p1 TRINITY_DN5826_c0_g1~~TRINITY_DN5826_c0_g1_i1.p1  ORF type:complete len:220 (+),score=58.85 TRINITY_DN5826_c0_g1_i1:167-826(+)